MIAKFRMVSQVKSIAYGYKTPSAVVEAWMNSTQHRENILDEDFWYIGLDSIRRSFSILGTAFY